MYLPLVASLLLPGLATAHDQDHNYVTKVTVDDNYLYIDVVGEFSNYGCTSPYFARSKYPISDERTRAWLQIATTSFVSEKKVHVWTSGCVGGATAGYPILTELQMEQ
jgi:hypothetical protein